MIEEYFIETPQAHIKMGKLCWDRNEEPALSVKRGKRDEYETVSIAYLITQLSKAQKYMEAQHNNKSSK